MFEFFILSSANAFNLDKSKNLSFGERVNYFLKLVERIKKKKKKAKKVKKKKTWNYSLLEKKDFDLSKLWLLMW